MICRSANVVRALRLPAVVAALLVVSACASVAPATPEKAVQQRAQARWDALIAGDIEKAYGYLLPSYRSLHDLAFYRGTINSAVKRKAAEVLAVECKPESCKATVRLEAEFVGRPGGDIKTHYDEKWIIEDGSWWLFQD